ncbi:MULTISPECIES: peptidoglycan-binding protein LysM [Flavobacteriaceae]|uniref:Potassium binding protein Kbp n=2 Tax=Flavobacteriaceae TaxID=49546 RepID=A0A4Y8AS39_9FLAO|nr:MULTISPECIES: peptidoglycan-binding protein LysM [Flavobacteriaceae]TEW74015.1 peptidoglycan-binding protein LysM [Gramella jeungdoensis]GGK39653.1 peptidoglycan-binding protein LysM [Lutibacter litoralis]
MGLFSFIKNAGAKVFGIGKTTAEETADEATLAKQKATKLSNAVETLGFKVQDLNIEVNSDNATVWGQADSQATREKVILVLGNTEGIATVDDRMTVEISEPEAQFHTFVKGDYLSKIAKKYYGDAMKYPVIFEANKPMLTNPDNIYPGQVLRIPALD